MWWKTSAETFPPQETSFALFKKYTPGVGNLRHACHTWHTKQGRIKGGGNGAIAPGPPLQRGPRDEIYMIQIKYSCLKNLCDSEAIQEYNSILYSYVR